MGNPGVCATTKAISCSGSSGRDRQRSASYYTPEVLTEFTVRHTLDVTGKSTRTSPPTTSSAHRLRTGAG